MRRFTMQIACRMMLPFALGPIAGLLASAEPSTAPGASNPSSLVATATVSNVDGAETALRAFTGGLELRLWAVQPFSWPEDAPDGDKFRLSGGLAFPYVRAGMARPAGLAAFLCRPAAAGPILLSGTGAPLELEHPRDAAWRGASLGEDFGLLYLSPASEPGNSAFGAWASPRGGRFSVIAAGGREIAHLNGDDWYDPPAPAAERVWAAAAAEAGGTLWALAAAGALGASFPGMDSFAARAEGWVRLGPVRLEAEASSASAFWRGLAGKAAPPFRVDAGWRYTRRGAALGGGWRGVQTAVGEGIEMTATGFLEAVGWPGRGKISGAIAGGAGDDPVAFELETWFCPRIAPWLTLSTSWRAVDGEAARFDIEASSRFGERVAMAMDAGVRMVPEGALVDFSIEGTIPLRFVFLSLGVGSVGWIEPASVSFDTLEYRIRSRLSLR